MIEAINLIKIEWAGAEKQKTSREVLAIVKSVGYREFYASSATDFRPELKFVLSDYLDYEEETHIEYNGNIYRILRTYRAGNELELTVEKVSESEIEVLQDE